MVATTQCPSEPQIAVMFAGLTGSHAGQGVGVPPQSSFSTKSLFVDTATHWSLLQPWQHERPLRSRQSSSTVHSDSGLSCTSYTSQVPALQRAPYGVSSGGGGQ